MPSGRSSTERCPVCGRYMEVRAHYSGDYYCGHCRVHFDKERLENGKWKEDVDVEHIKRSPVPLRGGKTHVRI